MNREQRRRVATDELIDRVALEEMTAAHGVFGLEPVAVVIAAYREVDNIGAVLAGMPERIGELGASVVVVVDGEDDGTGAAVRAAGHVACIAPVNRGQGAALRLGYRVAREHGARYIVTADGDGQTDPADLAVVLAPVVEGEADFSNGSRRLGTAEAPTLVRSAGVVVFSWLIRLLTGARVTDTANPVRAMRAEITEQLVLVEPQYQASELLLEVIMRGYRLVERPVTMRRRKTGRSKKGGTLAYGWRYGRVVLRTWRRERANRAGAGADGLAVSSAEGTP
jgi:glycosyltransferase involved in cell wall biosynthesis